MRYTRETGSISSMLRLTHYPLCPHSRSIRLVLGELRLEFELNHEEPWAWRQSFLSLNPSGALPVLEIDDVLVLCGTYAISEYLSECYPEHPDDGGTVARRVTGLPSGRPPRLGAPRSRRRAAGPLFQRDAGFRTAADGGGGSDARVRPR